VRKLKVGEEDRKSAQEAILDLSSLSTLGCNVHTRQAISERKIQAEWTWINTGMVDLPKVTNPSTNL